MSMILVLLRGLGEEKLPEWEVTDPALYQAVLRIRFWSFLPDPNTKKYRILIQIWIQI
jgi:hypothetical protein